MSLKFSGLLEVVDVHVCAKFHQAECSSSSVIVPTVKKNFDEYNTVHHYSTNSNKTSLWNDSKIMVLQLDYYLTKFSNREKTDLTSQTVLK